MKKLLVVVLVTCASFASTATTATAAAHPARPKGAATKLYAQSAPTPAPGADTTSDESGPSHPWSRLLIVFPVAAAAGAGATYARKIVRQRAVGR